MNHRLLRIAVLLTSCAVISLAPRAAERAAKTVTRIQYTFVGTTPGDPPVLQELGIPSGTPVELIEWSLTLHQDGNSSTPTSYDLDLTYGLSQANRPGVARNVHRLTRQGTWTRTRGIHGNPRTTVVDLDSGLAFGEVSPAVLHLLNADRSLAVGNGGWSYSLSRADLLEPPPSAPTSDSTPDVPYTISPVSSGPSVFGVFEGRTPCSNAARELRQPVSPSCLKAKWRITLYQNPGSAQPTSYKIEGTLFRTGAREGRWHATPDGQGRVGGTIYRLDGSSAGPPVLLLRGDENVLFLLDRNQQVLPGRADFTYTFDRRRPPSFPTR